MRRVAALATIFCWLLALGRPALARDLLFWNLTEHEFTGVYLASPGSSAWGGNMAAGDDTVGVDERVGMPGVLPGQYDVRLVDNKGRTCIVRGATVKGTGKIALSIAEEQLTDCTQAP